MRIYLSGPISNNPNYLIDFANAQRELEAKGHEVINPARLSQFFPESITKDCEPGSENYKRILDVEKEIIIQMADAVYLLKGWMNSNGARFEKEVADSFLSKQVLYAPDAERPEDIVGGYYKLYKSPNGYSGQIVHEGYVINDRDGNEILYAIGKKTPEEVIKLVDRFPALIEALKEENT